MLSGVFIKENPLDAQVGVPCFCALRVFMVVIRYEIHNQLSLFYQIY